MDLGLDFDDDDFESKKSSDQGNKKSYNAKFCHEHWYNTVEPEPENAAVIIKFRGDNSYHKKNYHDALQQYKDALGTLPANNKVLRQDLMECLARCYLHMEKYAEAMDISQQLVRDAKSSQQQMQTWLLLSQVQEEAGDFYGLEETLKLLLMMHPFTYTFWIKMGTCYSNQTGDRTPSNKEELRMRELTCLIRARLLLKNILRNAGSVFKSKLTEILQKVEDSLLKLNADDSLIDRAIKHLREDIYMTEEDNGESNVTESGQSSVKVDQEKEESSKDTTSNFDLKWFSWININNDIT